MPPSSIHVNLCTTAVPYVGPIAYDGSSNNTAVNCMDIDPATGDIYIGGSFYTVNGQARHGLACITRKGVLKSWNPGIDLGGSVFCIKFVSTALIIVGGTFTGIGGGTGTTPCNFLAAVDATGAVVTGFLPASIVGNVFCIDVDANGIIFVGGSGAAALNTAGVPQTWFPSAAFVTALKCAGSGTSTLVYLGGDFTTVAGAAGPVTRDNLAQVHGLNGLGTDGQATTWVANCTHLGSPAAVYITGMCVDSGGTLYVAGNFDTIAGISRPCGLAGLSGATPTVTAWSPTVTAPYLGTRVAANGLDIYWSAGNTSTSLVAGVIGCMDSTGTAHAWDAYTGPPYASFLGQQVQCLLADPGNPLVPAIYVGGFFQAVLNDTYTRGSFAKFADRTITPTHLAF